MLEAPNYIISTSTTGVPVLTFKGVNTMSNQVVGVVESKSKKGDGIKVNGEWYNAYMGKGLESVQAGHNIEMLWAPDKTGRYKNIKSVRITGGAPTFGASSSTAAPAAVNRNSNLGVELGHAANLAADLVNHIQGVEAGSDDWYREWVKHTDKIFKAMRKLREMKAAEDSKPAAPAPTPILVEDAKTSDEEISLF